MALVPAQEIIFVPFTNGPQPAIEDLKMKLENYPPVRIVSLETTLAGLIAVIETV